MAISLFGGSVRAEFLSPVVVTLDKAIGSYQSPTGQSAFMNYLGDFSVYISSNITENFGVSYYLFDMEHYYGRYNHGFPEGFYKNLKDNYTLGTGLGGYVTTGNAWKYGYFKLGYNLKVNAYKYLKGVNILSSDLKIETGITKYFYLAYKRIIPDELKFEEGANKDWADAANNVISVGINIKVKPEGNDPKTLFQSNKYLFALIGASILSGLVTIALSN